MAGGVLMATFAEDVEIFREPLSLSNVERLFENKKLEKERKKQGGEGRTGTRMRETEREREREREEDRASRAADRYARNIRRHVSSLKGRGRSMIA